MCVGTKDAMDTYRNMGKGKHQSTEALAKDTLNKVETARENKRRQDEILQRALKGERTGL